MTADVRRLGPAHDDVEALLPWFVNGTLEPGERTRIERHLDECAHCRGEVEALEAFRTGYVAEDPARDSAAAFARLSVSLGAAPPPWHARARKRIHSAWHSLGRRPMRWLPWAAGVQVALIATIGVLAVLLVDGDRALPYRTLSAPDASPVPAGSVVVRFDPKTSEDELRRIVRTANARIVDGPTAADAYVLDVAGGDPAATVLALRAQKAVVLAESLRSER